MHQTALKTMHFPHRKDVGRCQDGRTDRRNPRRDRAVISGRSVCAFFRGKPARNSGVRIYDSRLSEVKKMAKTLISDETNDQVDTFKMVPIMGILIVIRHKNPTCILNPASDSILAQKIAVMIIQYSTISHHSRTHNLLPLQHRNN